MILLILLIESCQSLVVLHLLSRLSSVSSLLLFWCHVVFLYFNCSPPVQTPTTHCCILKSKSWKQKLYVFENLSFAVRLTNVWSIFHFKWLDVPTSLSQRTLYSQAVGVEKYKMYLVTSVSYIVNEDFIKSVDQQKESVKRTALGLDSPYVVEVRYY